MSNELSGKVVKILPEQTGQGQYGKWVKQEFVIETIDKYPKKVCFTTWADKTDEVKKLFEGDEVTVSFNAESREFRERWYTDLKAWKIQKAGAGSGSSGGQGKPDFPPITEDDIPPEENEDLPF
jgi:hypothetical protein